MFHCTSALASVLLHKLAMHTRVREVHSSTATLRTTDTAVTLLEITVRLIPLEITAIHRCSSVK